MSLIVRSPTRDIPLASTDSIKNLFFDRCLLSDEDVDVLNEALRQPRSTLNALYFFRNRFTTDNVKSLSMGLSRVHGLQKLQICSNPMENTGIVALSEALGNNASVEALHLWDNELNDDQAIILSEGLVRNTLLLEFCVPRNRIADTGANALLRAASRHPALRVLDMSFNRINGGINEGLQDTSLERLKLDGNILSTEAVLSIAEALAKNPMLHHLHLSRSNIQETGCRAIAQALCQNTHLVSLALLRNPLGSHNNNGLCDALQQSNRTLQQLLVDAPYRTATMDFWLEWNRQGRRLIRETHLPWSLWPHILVRASQPSIRYSFLSDKPELMLSSSSSS